MWMTSIPRIRCPGAPQIDLEGATELPALEPNDPASSVMPQRKDTKMLSKQGSNRLSLEELDASTQLIYIYYDFDMIFYDLQMGKRIGGLENGMLHETKSYFHSGCWYHMLQMRAATKRAAFWDAIAPSSRRHVGRPPTTPH